MIFALTIQGVEGDYIAYIMEAAVETVLRDNMSIIETERLRDAKIPLGTGELGVYRPWPLETPEGQEPKIELRNAYRIMQDGVWACGDGAAYEGAVLRQVFGIEAVPRVVHGGHPNEYHAVLELPGGQIYDPTKNFAQGNVQMPDWVMQYPLKKQGCMIKAETAIKCQKNPDGSESCEYPGGLLG